MAINLLLNALPLVPPLTGIGNYAMHLSDGLNRHPEIGDMAYMGHAKLGTRDEVVRHLINRKIRSMVGFFRKFRPAFFLRDQVVKYRLRGRLDGYLYHETNYILEPYDGVSIATIHDLSYLHYPQYHPAERIWFMERGMPQTLQRAAHLITDSEYVRQEVIRIFGVSPQRVSTVHLGVNSHYHQYSREQVEPVLRKYGLGYQQYVLIVGTFEPRKNLAALADAYCSLPTRVTQKIPLVHAGAPGWLHEDIENKLFGLKQKGCFCPLGFVDGRDLPYLYAGALSFAYPSLYEGFGLPVLEAMACGTPVLASNSSSLPEVVGNAGLLVNPQDPDDLRAGLRRLLEDEEFRQFARREGPRRAANFSWDTCVQRTVQLYRQVTRQAGLKLAS
jgi:alpha-1,3-rhamnosyl/mannosyltransferase